MQAQLYEVVGCSCLRIRWTISLLAQNDHRVVYLLERIRCGEISNYIPEQPALESINRLIDWNAEQVFQVDSLRQWISIFGPRTERTRFHSPIAFYIQCIADAHKLSYRGARNNRPMDCLFNGQLDSANMKR